MHNFNCGRNLIHYYILFLRTNSIDNNELLDFFLEEPIKSLGSTPCYVSASFTLLLG